jgi:flavin reductase (DIM6/NTAB) family NADH-FMN oxidoreductase RutF
MGEILGRLGGPRDESRDEEPASELGVDARGGRWMRRHLAAGVVAVTTTVGGRYRASSVAAHTIASLEPLQLLISIELDSQMDGWLQESGFFGLSILDWSQQFFADRFAGFAPLASSSFEEVPHFLAVTGAPLLSDAIGWADCRIIDTLETGDHRCFIGEALALGKGEGREDEPLLYYRNRYHRIG